MYHMELALIMFLRLMILMLVSYDCFMLSFNRQLGCNDALARFIVLFIIN